MSYTQPPSDIDPNIFREYDIRGVAGDNLSVETVYWIARAFATQCISQNIHKCAIGGEAVYQRRRYKIAFHRDSPKAV